MIYDPADVRISVSKRRLIGGGDRDLPDPPPGSTTALERRESWGAERGRYFSVSSILKFVGQFV